MSTLSSSLSIEPRKGGARKDARGTRQWRHSNTSRVICSLLLLSAFVFFQDLNISDSMIQNIETTATKSRNKTTSTVLLPSSAPASTTPFPDKLNVDVGDQDEERKSSDDENTTNTVQNDDAGSSSSIDPFEEQPGCSLLIQLARAGTPKRNLSMRKILKKFGKYVPVASSSSGEDHESSLHGPRYDHRSCFLMRPRYNCARNNQNATTNNTSVATDFAMVLETPMKTTTKTKTSTVSNHSNDTKDFDLSSSTVCDLQKFVHDAGGPAGVGRRMLQNYQKTKDIATTTTDDAVNDAVIDDHDEPTEEPIIEVLLVGTSRFRQIFEALVCGFSDQMTDLRLQLGGPVFNKDHKLMNAEEIGPLVDHEFFKKGSCYLPEAQADYSEFFRKDGTVVPNNHERCNDNIGMVEFSSSSGGGGAKTNGTTSSGGRIRFYNVFRPWAWTNVSPALEALGIEKKHKLDFVLWEPRDEADDPSWQYSSSSNLKSLYESIFDIQTTTITTSSSSGSENNPTAANDVSASNIEQHDAHELYKEIQVRDTGRYFGADNPWITTPPDEEHPCMPGMPDDKVNFLLWYMLSLSAIEEPNN
jgi:hypothetical protein